MEANELRIGNLVDWIDEIEYKSCYVTTIGDSGDVCLIHNDAVISTELKYCTPIPLTEEWLLKFGFEKEEGEDMILGINHALDICYDHNKIGLRDYIETSPFGKGNMVISTSYVDCEYVHQLQNLVFALTGEELKIQD